MPSHLTWITLRVIHIPTTPAATDSLRTSKTKTKEKSNLQKVLDTTQIRLSFYRRTYHGTIVLWAISGYLIDIAAKPALESTNTHLPSSIGQSDYYVLDLICRSGKYVL